MRHTRLMVSITIAVILGAAAASVAAAPPRVVNAIPDDGETNVDPKLKQIRVQFDQDMNRSGGFSICGGGPMFPNFVGRKPKWTDARTFVWSVRLEPDHEYAFSVNCSSAKNFRGVNGRPATPYRIRFSTGAGTANRPAGKPGKRPMVIEAIPDDGDTSVDPKLRAIRVVFDQDMNAAGGFSICGGGPQFPQLIGKTPRWIDARTLEWRVRLKPDHEYAFSINCPSAQNFRSVNGAPATPYPIRFRTAAGDTGVSTTLDPARNRKAIETLRRAITEQYAYADLRNVDWDAQFEAHAAALEASKKPAEFARRAGDLLAPAEDVHIWLEAGPATFASFRRNVKRNCDVDVLPSLVPAWKERGSCVATGRFDDDIGYVLIKSWSNDCKRQADEALASLLNAGELNGLIIDVRPNAGGSEPLARRFAGRFVTDRSVYSKHVNRDPGRPGGFSRTHERVLKPNRAGATYRGRVVVLIGPAVMSSCESFVLMMKQAQGCRTIGSPTYGSSGNPKPTDLGNGVTVYLPSWKDMLPNGDLLEGRGIQPDVLVETGPTDRDRGDPVLDAALDLLRRP